MTHLALKTHCPNGHAMTKANTYYHATRGYKQCRECQRARSRTRAKKLASRHGTYRPSRPLGKDVDSRVRGLMHLLEMDYAQG